MYRFFSKLSCRPVSGRGHFLLSAAAFLFFVSVMFSMVYLRQAEETLSARIAPDVLRFHVLANSDSSEDQALKLEVKQMLIDTIYAGLQAEGSAAPFSKEVICRYIAKNGDALEQRAEEFMAAKGFSYTATLKTEACYFPTKMYGDMVFPCGTYDAVRVLLGEGKGQNWWCVLYPPLCFTDNATAVVPDSSKAELQNLLTEDDFTALMKNRRVVFGDSKESLPKTEGKTQVTVRVRSRFLDLLTGR